MLKAWYIIPVAKGPYIYNSRCSSQLLVSFCTHPYKMPHSKPYKMLHIEHITCGDSEDSLKDRELCYISEIRRASQPKWKQVLLAAVPSHAGLWGDCWDTSGASPELCEFSKNIPWTHKDNRVQLLALHMTTQTQTLYLRPVSKSSFSSSTFRPCPLC